MVVNKCIVCKNEIIINIFNFCYDFIIYFVLLNVNFICFNFYFCKFEIGLCIMYIRWFGYVNVKEFVLNWGFLWFYKGNL